VGRQDPPEQRRGERRREDTDLGLLEPLALKAISAMKAESVKPMPAMAPTASVPRPVLVPVQGAG
jgi:hypothetical protein